MRKLLNMALELRTDYKRIVIQAATGSPVIVNTIVGWWVRLILQGIGELKW